jgi:hypothetical protein
MRDFIAVPPLRLDDKIHDKLETNSHHFINWLKGKR